MKFVKWLDEKFEETLIVILLILISVVCLLQVVIRKIPFIPSLTWAEELCRFFWIWSVFLSLPYTIRKNNMLRVGVVMDLLPDKIHKIVNLAVDVVNTACMGLLAYWSVFIVRDIVASGEVSPAMLWPMWIVYVVMLIGFFLATIRGVQAFIIHIKHFNEKELSTTEQTMADAKEEAAAAERAEGGNN